MTGYSISSVLQNHVGIAAPLEKRPPRHAASAIAVSGKDAIVSGLTVGLEQAIARQQTAIVFRNLRAIADLETRLDGNGGVIAASTKKRSPFLITLRLPNSKVAVSPKKAIAAEEETASNAQVEPLETQLRLL